MNLKVSGLAAHGGDLDTNHSWKLVQRGLLGSIDSELLVENHHPDWQDLEPHEHDVILLVKESISSTKLSQRPQLLLPATVAQQLNVINLEVNPRVPMEDRTLAKYKHTAEVVQKPPWNLLLASDWLTDLCAHNESGVLDEAQVFDMLANYTTPELMMGLDHGDDGHVLHAPLPRQINIARPTAAETKKRMGLSVKVIKNVLKRPAAAKGKAAAAKPMAAAAVAAAAAAAAPGPALPDVAAGDDDEPDAEMAVIDAEINALDAEIEQQMKDAIAALGAPPAVPGPVVPGVVVPAAAQPGPHPALPNVFFSQFLSQFLLHHQWC